MKYKKWNLAAPDRAAVSALAGAGLPVLAALVLCARGLSEPGAAQAFLSDGDAPLHDPFLMRDDLQNNLKAQQSAGYKHWATIENLKRAAETLNFLTEHGIGSLEDLSERCDGAASATARVKADLRATEKEMERLTLTMKHAATYRQLRPLYDQYRQSRDKEKFLRGHEGEIILFEAAARELKRLDAVPLPATQRLRAEMDELTARRTALQSEYRKVQREEREYDTLRQNVEALLEKPREAEPQRQRNNELE